MAGTASIFLKSLAAANPAGFFGQIQEWNGEVRALQCRIGSCNNEPRPSALVSYNTFNKIDLLDLPAQIHGVSQLVLISLV